MPATLFLQAKVEADKQARAYKSHHVWGTILFKSLRLVLAGKSKHEINKALFDARGAIEQRSLYIRDDRIMLLNELKKLEQELLGEKDVSRTE
jgi:hypothetical protein